VLDVNKRNASGHNWSYELEPSPGSGNFRSTPAEGFTRGELFATVSRPEERFVATDTADYLSTYLNGESVQNQDVVLWYTIHKHHEVRDEDAPYMPIEWLGFEIRPRNFFDQNPMD
jgi:primary-amine oxidase